MKQQSKAFTLLELLVVVTILSILAALLLASLSAASEQGRSARCKSNLRQFGIALNLYSDDHAAYPLLGSKFGKWYDSLLPYVDHSWTNQLYSCPTFRGPALDGRPGTGFFYLSSGSYGLNIGTCDATGTPRFGLAGHWVGAARLSSRPTKASEVAVPSAMLAVGDGAFPFSGGILSGMELFSRFIPMIVVGELKADPKLRHNGRLNAVMLDGHTASPKLGQIFGDSPRWLSQWHTDNQPHSELFDYHQ